VSPIRIDSLDSCRASDIGWFPWGFGANIHTNHLRAWIRRCCGEFTGVVAPYGGDLSGGQLRQGCLRRIGGVRCRMRRSRTSRTSSTGNFSRMTDRVEVGWGDGKPSASGPVSSGADGRGPRPVGEAGHLVLNVACRST
jgi:hypothetical protein